MVDPPPRPTTKWQSAFLYRPNDTWCVVCDTGDSLDIEDHQLRADAREVLRVQSEAETPAVAAAQC